MGHNVALIGSGRAYTAGRKDVARWWVELADLTGMGWQLIRAARPDVILCLTSPPGLILITAVAAWWHRCRLIHWVMDLYPDIAFRAEWVKSGWGQHLIHRLFNLAYRRCEEIVVLDAAMASRVAERVSVPVTIRAPWPCVPDQEPVFPGWSGVRSTDPVWLYSGNLGQAHLWQPLIDAQRHIEAREASIHLVIQGGGAGWEAARRASVSDSLRRVHCVAYCPPEFFLSSLLRADIHVASLEPGMEGLLWPSKLALLIESGKPLAWVGQKEGLLAEALRSFRQVTLFSPEESSQLADWVIEQVQSGQSSLMTPASLRERAEALRGKGLEEMIQRLIQTP